MIAYLRSWHSSIRSVLRGSIAYWRSKKGLIRVHGLRMYFRSRIRLTAFFGRETGRMLEQTEVRVFVGGQAAFRRIKKVIRKAKTSIAIQTFIWKEDETGTAIAKLLSEAADRGVHVTVSKEAVGDFFEVSGAFIDTKFSGKPEWKAFWSHPRITVVADSHRDHAKTFVIDGSTVLLGGMNIADEYSHEWHDFLIEIRGHKFAEQVLTRVQEHIGENEEVQMVMNGPGGNFIRPTIQKILSAAKKYVLIEHCYFTDQHVLDQVAELTHRGVDVIIVIPGVQGFLNYSASRVAMEKLEKKADGGHLHLFSFPRAFHSKVLLVDGVFCLIGSANLNVLSLDQSGEACVLLSGKSKALGTIESALVKDILHSDPIASVEKPQLITRIKAMVGL